MPSETLNSRIANGQHMKLPKLKTKQRKDFPKIRNEIILMKSFLEPEVTEKYMKKEKV